MLRRLGHRLHWLAPLEPRAVVLTGSLRCQVLLLWVAQAPPARVVLAKWPWAVARQWAEAQAERLLIPGWLVNRVCLAWRVVRVQVLVVRAREHQVWPHPTNS